MTDLKEPDEAGTSGLEDRPEAASPTLPAAERPAATWEFDPTCVLFQGSGILAVDKPAGIPVHRGTGHDMGLAEMIDEWIRMHPGVLEARGGKPVHPAHRLDREASGVLLFALHRAAASRLQTALGAGEVKKRYLAVVAGPIDALGRLEGRVRSRLRGVYRGFEAALTYRRLAGDERLSLVEVTPHGGRTHQIRAIFAQAGRPLAGDLRYGKPRPSRQFLEKFGVPYFILHALEVTLPARLGTQRTIQAPLPAALKRVIELKGWTLSIAGEAVGASGAAVSSPG